MAICITQNNKGCQVDIKDEVSLKCTIIGVVGDSCNQLACEIIVPSIGEKHDDHSVAFGPERNIIIRQKGATASTLQWLKSKPNCGPLVLLWADLAHSRVLDAAVVRMLSQMADIIVFHCSNNIFSSDLELMHLLAISPSRVQQCIVQLNTHRQLPNGSVVNVAENLPNFRSNLPFQSGCIPITYSSSNGRTLDELSKHITSIHLSKSHCLPAYSLVEIAESTVADANLCVDVSAAVKLAKGEKALIDSKMKLAAEILTILKNMGDCPCSSFQQARDILKINSEVIKQNICPSDVDMLVKMQCICSAFQDFIDAREISLQNLINERKLDAVDCAFALFIKDKVLSKSDNSRGLEMALEFINNCGLPPSAVSEATEELVMMEKLGSMLALSIKGLFEAQRKDIVVTAVNRFRELLELHAASKDEIADFMINGIIALGKEQKMEDFDIENMCQDFKKAVENYQDFKYSQPISGNNPAKKKKRRLWKRVVLGVLAAVASIAVCAVLPSALSLLNILPGTYLSTAITGACASTVSSAIGGSKGSDLWKAAASGAILAVGAKAIGDTFAMSSSNSGAVAKNSCLPSISSVFVKKALAEGCLGGVVNAAFVGGKGCFFKGFVPGFTGECVAGFNVSHGWEVAALAAVGAAIPAAVFGGNIQEAALHGLLICTLNHAAHEIVETSYDPSNVAVSSTEWDQSGQTTIKEMQDGSLVIARPSGEVIVAQPPSGSYVDDSFFGGVITSIKGCVQGICDLVCDFTSNSIYMIQHPIDSTLSIVQSVVDVVSDPKGVWKSCSADMKKFQQELFSPNVSLEEKSRLLTVFLGSILPMGRISKLNVVSNSSMRVIKETVSDGTTLYRTKSHGRDFRKAKKQAIEMAKQDEKLSSVIRGWYKNEERRVKCKGRYCRNPPGFDWDHTRDHPDAFRLQFSADNRSRGAQSKPNGKYPNYEKLRTEKQPGKSGKIIDNK